MQNWLNSNAKCPTYIEAQVNKFKALIGPNKKTRALRRCSEFLYGKIYQGAMEGPSKEPTTSMLDKAKKQALLDVGMIMRGLCKLCPSVTIPIREHLESASKYIPTQSDIHLLHSREAWDNIARHMARKRANTHEDVEYIYEKIPGFLTSDVFVSSTFMLLNTPDHTWIFDYEQVLCILDTLISRQLVCTYAGMAEANPNIYIPKVSTILKCYKWGDRLLLEHGNLAYKLITFWEPIILCSLINKVDTWILKGNFLQNMIYDYHQESKKLGIKCKDGDRKCGLLRSKRGLYKYAHKSI